MTPPRLTLFALDGLPEFAPGDDLPAIIAAASARQGVEPGDILAVTSKIVSKAEGRIVSAADREQSITDETVRVVATREHPGGVTRIVENRLGLVMAAAGVDASNTAEGTVLLLPLDPDASATAIRAAVSTAVGGEVGVIITDTAGRAWREGQTDIAIGGSGVRLLDDLRGRLDAHGRRLDVTAPAGMVASYLRRGLEDFPTEITKLVPDPARVAECRAWLDTLGPGPKIGLAWSSSMATKLRALMYTDLKDWTELFVLEGVSVVNLQYTNVEEDAAALKRDFGLTLHSMPDLDLFNDIEGAAALTSGLDTVVAPASFPLVLGAALGLTCFYYAPTRGWTKLGTDHVPWFPNLRCHVLDHTTDRAKLAKTVVSGVREFLAR